MKLLLIYILFIPIVSTSQSLNYVAGRMELAARGEALIKTSYNDIINLKLRNKENQVKLNTFFLTQKVTIQVEKRIKRKIFTELVTFRIFSEINELLKVIDLSNYNVVSNISNQIESILNEPTIKSELSIINKIENEIYSLKIHNPSNYYNMERYNQMLSALSYLTNCGADKIEDMLFKYKLY